ncbi:elongation factor G [Clostridium novyi B str. ATCC 27606]|uniref:Elongation factor G n=1 Tax=Clostridium novyi B str. ATCC 27606 TaxID=1443123 RepID=A0AA40IWU2_CLONO|nr:elongation factor G [Clostridium novyi]KEI12326.1 elongation factor G [Clostridium novyi B str. NCTC 9691]KEI18412.1 elongation factor G [Clostridium novyi B str. ATCC 27606]
MKSYSTHDLRNIGFIGHSGSGKTTLTESILYCTKTIDRFGKISEGNTTSDYDPEEKKRRISISTSIIPCEYNNIKINIFDTPGYFDFVGETIQALKAIDTAIITLSGKSGVKVGTEKAWEYVNKFNMPRAFFINKLDRENSNFTRTLYQLKDKFGMSIVPIQYPIGLEDNFRGVINLISKKARIFNKKKACMEITEIPNELLDKVEEFRNMIMESVAESDEVLLEKYFNEGLLTDEELYNGIIKGVREGYITPVLCGSALKGIGINSFLDDIVKCFPSPKECNNIKAVDLEKNKEITINIDEKVPFSGFVFKTIADPFVGKLSIFKVITGKVKSDDIVYNVNKKKQEKFAGIYFIRGKDQLSTKEIVAGDIGAVPKLQYTTTGDTVTLNKSSIVYNEMVFPEPVISMSIIPKSKGDEDKISSGLTKLLDEDPTFKVSRDVENADTIISGIGETHLDVIASKLKNKFGVDIELQTPKVPYRETIKKLSEVQGKHKKQSGGHGQYGDVKIRFEPRNDGNEELLFIDKIVGGVVPKQYIPAVEKGLKEAMKHGVLAGFPVIGLKATLYDGSYHPVDSSEMAFKVAASLAYKKGIQQGEPILLEPIMQVEIKVPNDYMGEIISDINKKRGKILGMDAFENLEKIIAEVPMAEMFKYATDLRALTGGRGDFRMTFKKYEEVPYNEVQKIISNIKK